MLNSQSNEQITQMLTIIIAIMVSILFVLSVIYIIIITNNKAKKNRKNVNIVKDTNDIDKKVSKNTKQYNKQPITKFMEFDKIEDNMIVQKDGNRFLMVIQCQGVNYDLMSSMEKVAVEEGFIEFLNTLRHPIQIYVQTRTVNLENSVATYKSKVADIENQLAKMKMQYKEMVDSNMHSKEELNKYFYEITKQTNLYEYAKDIINNTEKMSLNKNVLSKQYYIIVPHYPTEAGNEKYSKEEIKNIAFSELYTKAQSIIRTISSCSVNGRILTSNELVDLLYVAYNRDESEVFGLDKVLRSGYDELYSTAPDVLNKKMKLLDEEIERKAIELANEKIFEVKSEKEQKIKRKEENIDELIKNMAKIILQENKSYLGQETVKESIKKIDEELENKEKEEEGGKQDVEQEKKTRGRKPKQSI